MSLSPSEIKEHHLYENARGKEQQQQLRPGWEIRTPGEGRAALSGRLLDSERRGGGHAEVACRLCVGVTT